MTYPAQSPVPYDDWFPPNPLDSMPIATNKGDDWFNDNPDESDEIEKEKTMHQKMYEIATAKYNPFAIGGSDNFQGGSENLTES